MSAFTERFDQALALAREIKQAEFDLTREPYGGYPWEHLGDASRDVAVLIRGLLEAEAALDRVERLATDMEAERDALAEAQQFPVSTVMSWKRRAEGAEALMRYARILLDPERQDEPEEENALRAYEVLSGVPLSVPARIDETDLLVQERDELNLQNEALGNALVDAETEANTLREALTEIAEYTSEGNVTDVRYGRFVVGKMIRIARAVLSAREEGME